MPKLCLYPARHARRLIAFLSCLLAICFVLASCTRGGKTGSADLRERVRRLRLENGMTFLIVERQGAPVFTGQIMLRVGAIEEEPGQTGLAHFFEHMAFKGTDKIGTSDFAKEKPLLDEILRVGTKIAELKKAGRPPVEYADLLKRRLDLEARQNKLIRKNEFFNLLQRNGGVDINAATSSDYTVYFGSFPANKLELWAYLESERLKNSVPREFFTEVDVVLEERRMTIDNSPDGRLFEAYLRAGFEKSPYRMLTIGLPEDVATLTPAAAEAFFKRYYVPSRMYGAIVGNVDADQAEAVVRKYFGALPAGQGAEKTFPKDDFTGKAPRHVTLKEDSPSRMFLGYHRPAFPHADDTILDVIEGLLCDGETSRLHRRLVLVDALAESVDCYASFPGERLDSLFTFEALPLGKHTNRDVHDAIKAELAKLAAEGPSERELQIIKNRLDAELVYSMEENAELAAILVFYEMLTGRWEYIYDLQTQVHQVTAEDVKRVIKTYFVPEREVSAYLEPK